MDLAVVWVVDLAEEAYQADGNSDKRDLFYVNRGVIPSQPVTDVQFFS